MKNFQFNIDVFIKQFEKYCSILMKEALYSKYILEIDAPQDLIFIKNVYKCKFNGYEIINQPRDMISSNNESEYMKLILPINGSKMSIKSHKIIV